MKINTRPSALYRRPSQSGFTLIEIMIVIGIIGLLMAIAIPNYASSRQKAHKQACICNLHLIDGVISEWAVEGNKQAGQAVTYQDIRPYLKNPLFCPAGGATFSDSYEISTVDAPPACLRVPEGTYAHKLSL